MSQIPKHVRSQDIQLVAVTDGAGNITHPEILTKAVRVHRQLRPHLPSETASYLQTLQRVCAGGGRIILACDEADVIGVAVYRVFENTFRGQQLYVDDLVTDETRRSQGVGVMLLGHCEKQARTAGCKHLVLDSGTQRAEAHRFYFREGLAIRAFNFSRPLDSSL